MFDTIQKYIFDTSVEPFFGRRAARRRRQRKIRRAKKKAQELGDSMESNKNQSEKALTDAGIIAAAKLMTPPGDANLDNASSFCQALPSVSDVNFLKAVVLNGENAFFNSNNKKKMNDYLSEYDKHIDFNQNYSDNLLNSENNLFELIYTEDTTNQIQKKRNMDFYKKKMSEFSSSSTGNTYNYDSLKSYVNKSIIINNTFNKNKEVIQNSIDVEFKKKEDISKKIGLINNDNKIYNRLAFLNNKELDSIQYFSYIITYLYLFLTTILFIILIYKQSNFYNYLYVILLILLPFILIFPLETYFV